MGRTRIRPGDGDPRHGTDNGYRNLGCRCDACRRAFAVYYREKSHRTGRHRPLAEHLASLSRTHGTISCYKSGCRCDDCRRVSRETRRRQRANA